MDHKESCLIKQQDLDLDKAVELGFSRQEADKILEALKSESKKFRR